MTEAALVIDTATLRSGDRGAVTGDIWLEIGRRSFPMKGWNDFVVVVVGAWLRAALDLFGGRAEARVHFMEGPFVVELSAVTAGAWSVRLVESGPRPKTIAQVHIQSRPFAAALISTAHDVVAACRKERTLWSRDAQSLEQSLASLMEVVGQRKRT